MRSVGTVTRRRPRCRPARSRSTMAVKQRSQADSSWLVRMLRLRLCACGSVGKTWPQRVDTARREAPLRLAKSGGRRARRLAVVPQRTPGVVLHSPLRACFAPVRARSGCEISTPPLCGRDDLQRFAGLVVDER